MNLLKNHCSCPVLKLTIRLTLLRVDERLKSSRQKRSPINCSSLVVFSMDLRCEVTWRILMSVSCLSYQISISSCNTYANVFVGYVKEQSLKGIVEWFDFWLSQ